MTSPGTCTIHSFVDRTGMQNTGPGKMYFMGPNGPRMAKTNKRTSEHNNLINKAWLTLTKMRKQTNDTQFFPFLFYTHNI